MIDVVNASTRSRMMAGIRPSNTKPERLVRSALHRRGLRFARSSLGLVGQPDAVLPRWRVAVFVNGCFWHLHGCKLSKLPTSNPEFWSAKLLANQIRDSRNVAALVGTGWRVLCVWECALRGADAKNWFGQWMEDVNVWIRSQDVAVYCDVSGAGVIYKAGFDESN
jgi:DNA mismatch endonuclease (patch repair protein)